MLFGIKHDQVSADFEKQRLGSVDAILIASDLPFMAVLLPFAFFVGFAVPETRGKSVQQIMAELADQGRRPHPPPRGLGSLVTQR